MWRFLPSLVRGVGRLAWGLEVCAAHGFPEPPFVVAANHYSFLDPLLIGAIHRRKVRFLALVDLFGNYRWLDFALTVFDVIPLERGVLPLGPVRASLGHLSNGGVVGLFPEGTRHREFDPDRSRPGAAWLAARTGLPLVPVAVSGTDRVLGVDNRLRRARIRVTVGPPMWADGSGREAVDELTDRWGSWIASTLQSGCLTAADGYS